MVTFRSAAERYVAVIEAAEARSRENLFADLARVLPVLYEAGPRLPKPDVETSELPETRVTQEQRREVVGRLGRVFGAADFYYTVVPFGDDKGDELGGSLTDDLTDIYCDVKEGLELAAAGESENEVLWQWRFTF